MITAAGAMVTAGSLLEMATDEFGIEIARVYGSSEAPNFSGSTPDDDRERRLSDDGALMPGSEVRVGSGAHAQEGMVRGPGVFLGYSEPEDNAAAFGLPDRSTGERLAVAVHPEDTTAVTLEDVVDHLLARGVARRKLPEEVVIWNGPLPRTPSGKVVRSRLAMEAPGKRSQGVERLR